MKKILFIATVVITVIAMSSSCSKAKIDLQPVEPTNSTTKPGDTPYINSSVIADDTPYFHNNPVQPLDTPYVGR